MSRSPRVLSTLPSVLNAVSHAINRPVSDRTLYGHPYSDVQSFFEACDADRVGAISCARLADALVRLNVGLTLSEAEGWVHTIDVGVAGVIELAELESWLLLKKQVAPVPENVRRKNVLATFEDDLYERRVQLGDTGVRLPQQLSPRRLVSMSSFLLLRQCLHDVVSV
jgi:hypothetical protein